MKLNKNLFVIFLVLLSLKMSLCKTRLLLTAALTDIHFEFRKQQYIESFNILNKYGYSDFYIVEALKKQGPTFLDSYSKNVFYSTVNNPNLKNHGINEAKTMLESLYYFDFNPEDIIIKLTGRYHLISDYLLKLVENNPDIDALVKINQFGDVFTLCFAMKFKYFQEMFKNMDYASMEPPSFIILEQAVGNYIKQKMKEGNFKVIYVEKLDVQANLFGSSTWPTAQGIVNF